MLNSNLVHNLINVIMIVIAALTAGLSAYGCTTLPSGAFDCTASTIPPEWSGGIITALGVLKMAINITRDGVKGLAKPQPPVEK